MNQAMSMLVGVITTAEVATKQPGDLVWWLGLVIAVGAAVLNYITSKKKDK